MEAFVAPDVCSLFPWGSSGHGIAPKGKDLGSFWSQKPIATQKQSRNGGVVGGVHRLPTGLLRMLGAYTSSVPPLTWPELLQHVSQPAPRRLSTTGRCISGTTGYEPGT